MAKRVSNSRMAAAATAPSSTNDGTPTTTPTTSNTSKITLRIKSSQYSTKKSRDEYVDEVCEKEGKRSSSNRSKSSFKNKKKVDPNKPKKPPTAFFYFLEDFRKGYQEENPAVKSMRDIGKACGEKWKIMTYEEKVKYFDIATEKRAEFDKEWQNTSEERRVVRMQNLRIQNQSTIFNRQSRKEKSGDRPKTIKAVPNLSDCQARLVS